MTVTETQVDAAPTSPQLVLEASGVTMRFGGLTAVDNVSMKVHEGEIVGLIGPNGAGKTTFFNCLTGMYIPTEGRVTIDGVDVRTVKLDELRSQVGIVFEDTFLFSDSVRANIAFADATATMEQVRRAAALAGADFIDDLPDGYETVIGEHGFSLSGGQRQRLAIARAVLADPRVLILDDATSSVDPSKEHEIRAALREVMKGRTTIIIAHRPATIALADRVVLLDGGRVVAQGTHEELVRTSERYRDVLAHSSERSPRRTRPGAPLVRGGES